jgi:oligopeptide transport system permease protein
MLGYTIKRLLQSCITILIVVTIVFFLLRMLPTDYYFTEEQIMKLPRKELDDQLKAAGLLDPPLVQLGRYYGQLARFDLGTSRRIQSGVPVAKVIGGKFMVSMRLGWVSLAISIALGISLGIVQTIFKEILWAHVGTAYTVFVRAVPPLVSYSLILVFGARVLHFPSMYSTRDVFRSSILPVVCLSVGSIAGYMIWIRRYMVDELNRDYVRLAKLKGMSTRSVMYKHVLKNAFVPMAQYLPQSVLLVVGGSLLVERFFSVPGLGSLLTDAVLRYDLNLVQALVMMYAAMGIVGVLLGDILMVLFDPRIRLTGKETSR